MLTFPATVRVFVCTLPTDMRKSFDGLSALAGSVVGQDPLSGHLFVFRKLVSGIGLPGRAGPRRKSPAFRPRLSSGAATDPASARPA